MNATIEVAETLADMRKAAGLTLEEVGRRLGAALGKPAYSHARIIQIEQDGTKDTDQIEALAMIFGRSFDTVYNASKKLRT